LSKAALIFTSIQGHAQIADALATQLKTNGWKVKIESYVPKVKAHIWLYRNSVPLMRFLAKLLNSSMLLPIEKWLLKNYYRNYIGDLLQKHRPELVISTFYLLNPSIDEWREKNNHAPKNQFYFCNFMTDPRTHFSLNPVETADVNMVFDITQQKLIEKKYPKIKTKVFGWAVRQEFLQNKNKTSIRKKLQLDSKKLTFLIVSGSLGNQQSADLMEFLLSSTRPLQIIFVAGSNVLLQRKVEKLIGTASSHKVFGYIKNISDYIHAADLVIGKAGPNTLFETAATLTPFFASNYGGNQEFGNLEIIKEYGLGIVTLDTETAQKELQKIINNPEVLKKFQPTLTRMKKILTTRTTLVLDKPRS
jgi:UDP-N-acetylglucosamine:LPS N-acetylglucosamine transferase